VNWAALLLSDASPILRRLVLRDLLGRSEQDQEVRELDVLCQFDPLAVDLLNLQAEDGSWQAASLGDSWGAGPVQATALALMRLGYLGYGPGSAAVQRGAGYLFARQQPDGSWPIPGDRQAGEDGDERSEGYAMMPLQTSLPLRGLAACGYATDRRAELAYDWLLAQRLPDGAWPTGMAAAGVYGYVAGYRRLPHSRWGCRSNTTGALVCLALHPQRCRSDETRRALDHLLGRETREEYAIGFEVARLLGAEPAHGFTTFYARFDLALLLDLCARVGASLEDERVRDLADFVWNLQGPFGLWEYPNKPQVSRWITFELLRALAGLAQGTGDWTNFEPRTPFQPYPRKQKRY
jgi:hypothetical protein